ncbi:MAG: glycosyl transferase [Gammaproteobacteria bacterium]|nr:glycosyl transferase [Gammaproteobacteria bacterium]
MTFSVSVIVPSFNRAPVLPRALDSLLAQTNKAAEIIVVDDGSSDGTSSLVKRDYPGVKLLVQENHGVSAARNAGVSLSSGEWLAFLDSDDEWLPEKLAHQLAFARKNPDINLIHTNEIWIRKGVRVNSMRKHRKFGGQIFAKCLPRCIISPSSAMISRTLFDRVGGFDVELPACEDYDLWLRVCHQQEVAYVERPLIKKYGGHEDQLSSKYWGMDRFRIKSLVRLLEQSSLNKEQEAMTRRTLHEKCRVLMNGAVKRCNNDLAAYCTEIMNIYEL